MKLHPYVLTPSLLDILDALPETLPVADWKHLLQVCTAAMILHLQKTVLRATASQLQVLMKPGP